LYDAWIINNNVTKRSKFNSAKITEPNLFLKYKDINPESADSLHNGNPLVFGLWHAFLHSTLKELSVYSKTDYSLVNKVSDNHTLTTRDLNREVIQTSLRFHIESFSIKNNELHLKLIII